MRIWINGITRDMTPEEESEYARRIAEDAAAERQRPATFEERMEAQIAYTAMMTDTLLED